jgi:signal transduction histidine kinase
VKSNFVTNFKTKSDQVIIGHLRSKVVNFGGKSFYQGIIRDITERKRAEQELDEYRDRLEELVMERTLALESAQEKLIRQERLAVLGQLAGGVGHELRNPLGVVTNAIYYLKMLMPEVEPTVAEYLDLIEENAQEATRIVSELLDYGKVQTSQPSPTAVESLVSGVISQHTPPENVQVEIDMPPDLPSAFVDPKHIRQVITNLVSNAYQAMPGGGQLTISAQEIEGGVLIAFSDTGAGISLENQEKIFEPLFTTKAKGIGLGLAITKRLVETNHGSIEFESKVGEGTTFRLELPCSEGEK